MLCGDFISFESSSIDRGEIKICKIHMDLNISDPLTKPLPQPKHERYTRAMGIRFILD